MNPAPKACPLMAHMVGIGNVITLPIRYMNSSPNTFLSPPFGWLSGSCAHSRSRPLEKNLGLLEQVIKAPGPSSFSISSRAFENSLTKLVFQRFSSASIVNV